MTGTNNTSTISLLPAYDCVPWVAVLIIECLAIVIFNMITIIVFAIHGPLQSKGTYILIRNLAVVDLLAGGISGPLQIERMGESCEMWDWHITEFTWADHLKFAFLHLFSMASLVNLTAISLERMNATFRPFSHLTMKKWVYVVLIVVIWLSAIIRECVQIALNETQTSDRKLEILINSTLYLPFYFISLLLICVSYISMFLKFRCSPQLTTSVANIERKLTFTLFTVTVASLLTLLPVIIFLSVETVHSELINLSSRSYFHLRMIVVVFFLANSLANPIIYAIRMQGFREGLSALCCRIPNHVDTAALQLRNLHARRR